MLRLPAQITLSEARQVRDGLLSQISAETGPDLVLDASALTQVDSATLAVLLACRRQAQGDAGWCRARRPSWVIWPVSTGWRACWACAQPAQSSAV
jgi:hypothetical protein